MKPTTSLCFSSEGLLNPKAISYISSQDIERVALFTDGSEAAYQHLQKFDFKEIENLVPHIGLGNIPLYELRVIGLDGTPSRPNYVFTEEDRMRWICSNICSPFLTISVSDISSQSTTEVKLDKKQTEHVCYLSYLLWSNMRVAEDKLCFPAAAIDTMSRLTYHLTANTIDIPMLRRETGLETLTYTPNDDMLSLEVAGELFSVKMSVLDEFYGSFILPIFNKILGRRMRIRVSVFGAEGHFSEPNDMSYGQLGRLVEELSAYAQIRKVTADTPMDPQDLIAFAKKVKIDGASCLWPNADQTITDLVSACHDQIVRTNTHNNSADAGFSKTSSRELVGEYS